MARVGGMQRHISVTQSYKDILSGSCWSVGQQARGYVGVSMTVVETLVMDKEEILKTIYECLVEIQ